MVYTIINIVDWVIRIFSDILLVRCIMSWFCRNPYTIPGRIYAFTIQITEPLVAPCRALMSRFNTGPIDFSVLVAFLILRILEAVIVRLLLMFI